MATKFLTTFLALFTISSAAFKVPSNQPYGIYSVVLGENGEEIHTKISDIDVSNTTKRDANPARSNEIVKRYNWPSGTTAKCNNGYLLSADFYDNSYNTFFNMCWTYYTNDDTVGGFGIYSYYGTSVAYMCNYSGAGNPCNPSEWSAAVNWVQGTCTGGTNGWVQAGYLTIPSWKKSVGTIAVNSTASECQAAA